MPLAQSDKKVSFLPFHAINEFMTPEFRLNVVRNTLVALPTLPEHQRNAINKLTSKLVKIPGFRNSLKAPGPLRTKPTIEAFEKSPTLVAAILAAWAEAHADLRQMVFDLLQKRGWELLPIDTDRTQLPGFLTVWPREENFDVIYQAFTGTYPDLLASSDDVSLMVVWLSGRLPYQFSENAEEPSNLSADA